MIIILSLYKQASPLGAVPQQKTEKEHRLWAFMTTMKCPFGSTKALPTTYIHYNTNKEQWSNINSRHLSVFSDTAGQGLIATVIIMNKP